MRHYDPARGRERGFSLVELMIAMVVTLVVSGAIYGLLSGGQNAFRREPELSDRQQNIRIAMAMLTQDASRAGLNLPPFVQAFSNNLNGTGPTAPSGARADEIEIVALSDCIPLELCGSPGVNVTTWEALPACFELPGLVALWNKDYSGIYWAEPPGGAGTNSCAPGSGPKNGHANLPPGSARFANPPGGPGYNPTQMGQVNVIRYRIAPDTDGVPNLWRSAYGGENFNGQSSWQIVARGIEDLQVSYLNAAGWSDLPGNVTCPEPGCIPPTEADYDRIVRQVRLVVQARATAANLQGQTTSAAGGTAVRGELHEEVTPRAALIALTGVSSYQWR